MNLPFQPGQIVKEGGVSLMCVNVEMHHERTPAYDNYGSVVAMIYGRTKFRVVLEGFADEFEKDAAGAPIVEVNPEQIREFGKSVRKLDL